MKDEVTRILGSRVARALRTYGGYVPSATFRLVLADGRRAFFKGTYPLPAGSGVRWMLEPEEHAYRRLGRYIHPWAPGFIGSARAVGWHVLLLEDVGGERVLPWTRAKARRAARSYAAFHRATYGRRLPAWLSRAEHRRFGVFWGRLAREEGGLQRVCALAVGRVREARAWLAENATVLARAERGLVQAREPFVLMHFDTRSDNVRLDGEVLRMFDWPFACVGPHEFDLGAFAQSVEAEGGPACEAVAAWYEEVLPLRRSLLAASMAGIAGYFADRAPRPPLAGLPRLRSIQRRQLKASLPWAARLLDLPRPDWIQAVRD